MPVQVRASESFRAEVVLKRASDGRTDRLSQAFYIMRGNYYYNNNNNNKNKIINK